MKSMKKYGGGGMGETKDHKNGIKRMVLHACIVDYYSHLYSNSILLNNTFSNNLKTLTTFHITGKVDIQNTAMECKEI